MSQGLPVRLQQLLSPDSIVASSVSASVHALLTVEPVTEVTLPPWPLDLALVIDCSGSMYEEDRTGQTRLQRTYHALEQVLERLRPSDRVSVIGFAASAACCLPLTMCTEHDAIVQGIGELLHPTIDQAATILHRGVELALNELVASGDPLRRRHVVVLLDGETAHEASCRDLAVRSGQAGIPWTLLGLGSTWNLSLFEDLARLTDGNWQHIDPTHTEAIEQVWTTVLGELVAPTFTNVTLALRRIKEVKLKSIAQLDPSPGLLTPKSDSEGISTFSLGLLRQDSPARILLELDAPRRPEGQYVLAQVQAELRDAANQTTKTDWQTLALNYTAATPGTLDPGVARAVEGFRQHEQELALLAALRSGDLGELRQVALKQAENDSLHSGPIPRRPVQLARQVLGELDSMSHIRPETILELADLIRSPIRQRQPRIA